MTDQPRLGPDAALRGVDLSIGDAFRLQVSLRPTPPVIVAAALLAAAAVLPAVWLIRSRRTAHERPIDLEAAARSWG